MRDITEIEKELEDTREALAQAEGSQAEVYSRIVGYYRSVRNWNKGKAEEYGERKLFQPGTLQGASAAPASARLLLFTRPACTACPSAKEAAEGLDIPVDFINTDTEEGMAEAEKWRVLATPTAIFLDGNGQERGRAHDAASIALFRA